MNTVLLVARPASIPSELDLDALAHAIAAGGVASHEPALRAVADAASRRDACPVLVALVTDQDAPRVARERAFGRLAAQLASRLRLDDVPPQRLCA